MIKMSEPDRLDDAGDYYCALGWAYARGKGKDIRIYEKEEKILHPVQVLPYTDVRSSTRSVTLTRNISLIWRIWM